MKTPVREYTVSFQDDTITYRDVIECCDSYVAVLTTEEVDEWFALYKTIVTAPDAAEFTDFGSACMVFDVDGKLLTVVSDSGGENASGHFFSFCESRGIDCQFVIDSIVCTDIELDDIYTGAGDDYPELLELIHRVFK